MDALRLLLSEHPPGLGTETSLAHWSHKVS